jgi:hypothetical protein
MAPIAHLADVAVPLRQARDCRHGQVGPGAATAEGPAVVVAVLLAVGAHPAVAGRAGRWVANMAKHIRPSIDPPKIG